MARPELQKVEIRMPSRTDLQRMVAEELGMLDNPASEVSSGNDIATNSPKKMDICKSTSWR